MLAAVVITWLIVTCKCHAIYPIQATHSSYTPTQPSSGMYNSARMDWQHQREQRERAELERLQQENAFFRREKAFNSYQANYYEHEVDDGSARLNFNQRNISTMRTIPHDVNPREWQPSNVNTMYRPPAPTGQWPAWPQHDY